VAHAEASARTVEAAVTAAAAQLGLRPDQVDVEVLEEPVPSTFGYIGTPARVRVTPSSQATPPHSSDSGASMTLGQGRRAAAPASAPPPATQVAAAQPTDAGVAASSGGEDLTGTNRTNDSYGSASPAVSRHQAPSSPQAAAARGAENGPSPSAVAERVEGQPPASGSGIGAGNHGSAPAGSTGLSASTASTAEAIPSASAISEPTGATRHRRTDRDEPIEPEMVEADTERAGDFLEGLLDALDVDGDITTWVDESGGHVDLEGSDLDVLVGSNGETLDALQELTRIAVLRQSKRRARLLLDINGYRARHREQLIAVVRATAERVIASREDHEFEPMTPAERKIVHDAVAAIDGVRTESLGEEPYRRVVIRPT
jgi:spoIIIJ-associated protein